jgi:hypothetical protein
LYCLWCAAVSPEHLGCNQSRSRVSKLLLITKHL